MQSVEMRVDIKKGIPHTFLYVHNPDGTEQGFGFYPDNGTTISKGIIGKDDRSPWAISTGPIELSQAQYDKLKAFIDKDVDAGLAGQLEYEYLFWSGQQCANWAAKGLYEAGVDFPITNMTPENDIKDFFETLYINPFTLCSYIYWYKLFLGSMTAEFQPIKHRDPLIIDLDGDGTETTYLGYKTYFDHDGNGFAEQTGWAAPDDGLLVRDINGNGSIDNGKELFGDQTILRNGNKATDGFAALSDLDDNGDGKIDSNDAVWNQLKVWQDANSDGISTSNELLTLDEAGIQSINIDSTSTGEIDLQGNTQTRIGSFEKTDNTTGQIGSYNLQRDIINTSAIEWVDVPDDIAALPGIQGYGNVYDLQQAMAQALF